MSDVLNRLKQFRATLYSLFPYRKDALFNLLDALRIASEITSYSWAINEHPDMGIAL